MAITTVRRRCWPKRASFGRHCRPIWTALMLRAFRWTSALSRVPGCWDWNKAYTNIRHNCHESSQKRVSPKSGTPSFYDFLLSEILYLRKLQNRFTEKPEAIKAYPESELSRYSRTSYRPVWQRH